MVENNFSDAVTTNMTTGVKPFSVQGKTTDNTGEQIIDYNDFNTYHGYYQEIPELKKAIDALATYCVGKGYVTDVRTKVILEHIHGIREDTFQSIMWNMLVTKKFNGDAFAEVTRDGEGVNAPIINIKPLNPFTMRTKVSKGGIITGYQQVAKDGATKNYPVNRILHLINDRVVDNVRGTSVIKACKWVIDARNEAMSDWRRISHRATIRVMYVDIRNTAKLARLKSDYKDAINKGELLILPVKKEDASFEDLTLPPVDAFLSWIKYLENFFYQAVGVPKVMLGGSEEFTEASSKIAFTTFDQIWYKEQRELEDDLWNQLYIKVKFNQPSSLMNELVSSEGKNTGQTGFQPNDVTVNSGAS